VTPPLPSNAFVLETRFLSPIPSREVVRVGIDARGTPVAVSVLHRLVVVRTGDYTFAVLGPIVDVERAPGSQSDPGLRRGAVLWAGFSPGNRVLAANVELVPARAAAFLPVRVSVRRVGGAYELRVRNATGVRVETFSAAGVPSSVAAAAAATRTAIRRDEPMGDAFVQTRGPARPVAVEVAAPLRVSGEFRSGRERRAVSGVLGDGQPLELAVRVPARGRPRVRLRVEPVAPVRTLARRGGDPRAQLDRVIAARLQLARARQYDRYLAAPDQNAKASAVFLYRTTSAPHVPPAPVPEESGGGSNPLVVIAAVACGLLLLGAALVWWAHS
jgi:hypothetical protein